MILSRLPEGSRFALHSMPHITGEVVSRGAGSVSIRLDCPPKTVEITRPNGKVTSFVVQKSGLTTWSRMTEVNRI